MQPSHTRLTKRSEPNVIRKRDKRDSSSICKRARNAGLDASIELFQSPTKHGLALRPGVLLSKLNAAGFTETHCRDSDRVQIRGLSDSLTCRHDSDSKPGGSPEGLFIYLRHRQSPSVAPKGVRPQRP